MNSTHTYARSGAMRIAIRPIADAAPLRTIAVDLHTSNQLRGTIGDHDLLVSAPAQDATGRTYRAVAPSRSQVKRILDGETLFIDMPQRQENHVFVTGLKAAVATVPMAFFAGDTAALARLAAGVGRGDDADRISALLYSAVTGDIPLIEVEVLLPQFVVDFVLAMGDTAIPPAYLQPIAQWLLPQLREV